MQTCHFGTCSKTAQIQLPSRELTYPPDKAYLKMIFLFPRWDMLISWGVCVFTSKSPLTFLWKQHIIFDDVDPVVEKPDECVGITPVCVFQTPLRGGTFSFPYYSSWGCWLWHGLKHFKEIGFTKTNTGFWWHFFFLHPKNPQGGKQHRWRLRPVCREDVPHVALLRDQGSKK